MACLSQVHAAAGQCDENPTGGQSPGRHPQDEKRLPMSTTYVVVPLLAGAMVGFSAASVFLRAK